MRVPLIITTVLLWTASFIQAQSTQCGFNPSDSEIALAEAAFQNSLKNTTAATANVGIMATPVIPVYFHVIRAGKTLALGNVPLSQIAAQMNVLNAAFVDTGLSFDLAAITFTENADWFNGVGDVGAMQAALHTGGINALNIYTVGFTTASPDLLGYSTIPGSVIGSPTDDGVVIRYSTLPGGTTTNYNGGQTLTHHTGHWVGLYHTFQGGCSLLGDSVADTPPEASPATGCPIGRDTCSGGGLDPIHNYMDFSYDSCKNNFTPGQITRLQAQCTLYRGIVF